MPGKKVKAPAIRECIAHIECTVDDKFKTGDHTIFIAEVEHVELREGEPLLYFRSQYRTIGKPE